MFEYTTKRCSKCMLQEDTSRGLIINDEGLCPLCRSFRPIERDWTALQKIFENQVNTLRTGEKYEAVLMMSGGKDSAYLAYLLKKKMKLKILGLTIDNGFEYPETFEKATALAHDLDIPHLMFRTDPTDTIQFYRFLVAESNLMEKDFGQICLYCGRYLLDIAATFANQMDIPAVFVGYNPEQLFGMGKTHEIETDPLRQSQQQAIAARITYLYNKMEKEAERLDDRSFIPNFASEPKGCKILYPFLYLPYRPQEIMETARQETSWKPITSFASEHYIASGCKLLKLMAALAKINNVSSYMDYEFSAQVRAGDLDKDALKRYYSALEESPEFYTEVLNQLGLNCSLEKLANVPLKAAG